MKRMPAAVVLMIVAMVPGTAWCQQPPAGPAAAFAAAVQEWSKTPYRLTLVIHVDEHPLLTPVFASRVRDEVRDALQRDLGGLCKVEAEPDHPLMQDILQRGWSTLDNRKYTIDELKQITAHYRALLRDLKKQQEAQPWR